MPTVADTGRDLPLSSRDHQMIYMGQFLKARTSIIDGRGMNILQRTRKQAAFRNYITVQHCGVTRAHGERKEIMHGARDAQDSGCSRPENT